MIYRIILGCYTHSEDVTIKGPHHTQVIPISFHPLRLHHTIMSPRTHNNQLPTFHDPLIQCVTCAYYHLNMNGSLVGIHGRQLCTYLIFDQALREDRRPSIPLLGYRQFTNLYNSHPATTENWATINDAGVARVNNPSITQSRFHVEDTDLV